MRSLQIAATGMQAQQTNVEVISNNIANMATTGHKRQRVEFQDLLYQNQRRVGSSTADANTVVPAGIQLGVGVRVGAVYRILEQGTLTMTNNPYDLAVSGRGYFQVQIPGQDQLFYTRAGAFTLNPQGQIVTQDGYPVQPVITIPQNATEVSISQTGLVQVTIPGQIQPQQVGQMTIGTFINPGGLESVGDNLMLETPASGQVTLGNPGAIGYGILRQGYLETSNVNPVTEITNLITAQRAYEMNSKVITTSDQMLQTTNQLR